MTLGIRVHLKPGETFKIPVGTFLLWKYDIGPIRDPVFQEQEPNPTLRIRVENGRVLWRRRQ